jgi:hypothetical protein
MPERIRQSMKQDLVVGGALVVAGVAALLAESSPVIGDAILKYWPLGVIGLGVALFFDRARS